MYERFKHMVRRARDMWFREMFKLVRQIEDGRKRRRCDENDEEQDVLNAPTMDWDVGDEMKNIRNYVV